MKKLLFKTSTAIASILFMGIFSGCASKEAPLPTPDFVNIDQFMGRWYVHGYTPLTIDKQAHNAIEHYRLDSDGKIRTTYQFRDGSFEGELKSYTPVGWVHDETTNAEWRMQFIWPFRSDYIILYLDADYSETIIAHPNRKYAWIMLREPEVSAETYARLLRQLKAVGYDLDMIQRLPQDWSEEEVRLTQLESEGL